MAGADPRPGWAASPILQGKGGPSQAKLWRGSSRDEEGAGRWVGGRVGCSPGATDDDGHAEQHAPSICHDDGHEACSAGTFEKGQGTMLSKTTSSEQLVKFMNSNDGNQLDQHYERQSTKHGMDGYKCLTTRVPIIETYTRWMVNTVQQQGPP